MERNGGSFDRERLVEQSPWLHAFARGIVRDPHGADDVAQDTLLAALATPPPRAGNPRRLRAWLGSVAYNLARLSHRRSSRRRVREEHAARHEALDSTSDSVIRGAMHELVAEAVESLEEPHRSIIALRYFENLSIAEIAERTATTEARVRKRLWRGRALLRVRLERRSTDRGPRDGEYWLSALSGLGLPGSGRNSVVGSIVLAKIAALTLFVGTGVTVGWVAWRSAGASADSRTALAPSAPPGVASEVGESAAELGHMASPKERTPFRSGPDWEGPRVSQEPLHQTSQEQTRVLHRGSVVDLSGQGVPEVDVIDDQGTLLGSTDPSGGFTLSPARYPVRLQARRSDLALVHGASILEESDPLVPWIVVGRSIDVAGRVLDPSGNPLPDATVTLVYGAEAFMELPVLVPFEDTETYSTSSLANGRFAFSSLPSGRGLWLEARHSRWGAVRVPVPPVSEEGLLVSFGELATMLLAGTVVDELGVPLAGARVGTLGLGTWTDIRGEFELQLPEASSGTLIATKHAFEPALLDLSGMDATSEAADRGVRRLRMVLGGRSHALSGRILAGDGTPVSQGLVFACSASNPPEERFGMTDPTRASTARGEEGVFELRGLSDSEYTIVAFDLDSKGFGAETFVPGTVGEFEIRTRTPGAAQREGHLLDDRGRPIQRARIETRLRLPAEAGSWATTLASTHSDERGRFALPDLPRDYLELQIFHPLLPPQGTIAPWPDRNGSALQIVPIALVSVWGRGDGVARFQDDAGNTVPVLTPGGLANEVRLFGGRSGCIAVGSLARSIECTDEQGTRVRLPLALDASTRPPTRIDLP